MAEQSLFDKLSIQTTHVPDVLSCIANLSNDEVFTPPDVVNKMLDLLPQDIFANPETTFLDPACKTGVFLREIAKRCLAAQLPKYDIYSALISEKKSQGIALSNKDIAFQKLLQATIDHIFHKQLFGIAITELTSLVSRRSVYCSKYPNCKYSITPFDDAEGNIRFRKTEHTWGKITHDKDGKPRQRCEFCGASRDLFDRGDELESHAYEFIHLLNPEEIFNMKFDVIISNPPYQMSFGIEGANSSNAKSIYNLFIDKAIKLNPRYITMIVPSRWMTKTAQGIPDTWVDSMLTDNKISIIHDYENVSDCFPGISLSGGVNYFLWDVNHKGKCDYYYHTERNTTVLHRYDFLDDKSAGIVIRNPNSYLILNKIENIDGKYYLDNDKNFSGLVSPKHFFDDSKFLTSNWKDYKATKDSQYNIKYYLNVDRDRTYRWINNSQLPKNKATKDIYKVFIPAANGSNDIVLGKPFIGEPNSVCSQTFLVIGYDPIKHNFTKQECENIIKYIHTKFFRYLVSIKKKTQNGPRGVYQFVPLQDFTQEITDEILYKKYNLNSDEIELIESSIREFES